MAINPREDKDQECLFLIAKEGVAKNAREGFFERVQSVNRYVISNLILAEPVIGVVRRELKKLAEGMRIEAGEVENIMSRPGIGCHLGLWG
jgi:hypothetical protein